MLPRSVAWFYLRAISTARRLEDTTTFALALPPPDLAKLLEVAEGYEHVVELGTGPAWTAIALALGDERRRVTTFDQRILAHRVRYLDLVRSSVRDRIDFRPEPIERAPEVLRDQVDFVSINSSGDPDRTIASYESADKIVRPGGLVVFLPYGEGSEGAGDAAREVPSDDSLDGGVFVWRKPRIEEPPSRPRIRLRSAARVAGIVLVGLALGASAGAVITLTDGGDTTTTRSIARPPIPRSRLPTVVPAGQAGEGQSRGSSSHQTRRDRARQPGARSHRTISGRGTGRLGTLRVNQPTAVSWRTEGKRLTLSSSGSWLNHPGKTGATLLSPGTYPNVRVFTTGEWTVRIKRP